MAQQQQETGASPEKHALASVLSYLRDKQLKVRGRRVLPDILHARHGVRVVHWLLRRSATFLEVLCL